MASSGDDQALSFLLRSGERRIAVYIELGRWRFRIQVRMRRFFGALSVVLVGLWGIRVSNARRESKYQSALRYYSQDIHPGMTRAEVLAHLRAKNATWHSELLDGCVDEVSLGFNFWTSTWVSVAFSYGPPKAPVHLHLVADETAVLQKVYLLRITDGP